MNPTHPSASVLRDNLHYLGQALALVRSIAPARFTHKNPPLYNSGVGPHLRHCMDHYELFLSGLESGSVDFDQRQRREDQQNDPRIMAEWIQALMRGMQGVGSERLSQGLRVKMDCGSELADPWSQSSVLRELQFLISHTVHHFALIRMILLDQGVQTPAGFGVAPSTLKHEASRAACAR
jgi:hypothetical protein